MLSQGEISRFYKEALQPVLHKYRHLEIIRIIKDAYLLEGGSVKEDIDIVFRYNGEDPLQSFFWHIPSITPGTRVEGLRIPLGVKANSYFIKHEELLNVIEIRLHDITKGTIVHLKFDYYITGVCEHKRGFLYDELYYPMAFIAADTVQSLDIRIHLPKAGAPVYDTNLPDFRRVIDSDEQVLLSTREGIVGDFSGYVKLKYKTQYYRPFWSAVIGILLAGALRGSQALGENWYFAIPILTSLALFALYSKFKD